MAQRRRKDMSVAEPEKPEEMLTLREAGKYFGRCGTTIGRWINDGLIKCVRLPNGQRVVPKSQVESVFKASDYSENGS
jgi:predicted site-specific integrase-resolvase